MPPTKLSEIEAERGDLEKIIPELLQKCDGSQKAVAAELDVSPSTVSVWLRSNGYVRKTVWVKEQAS